MLRHRNVNPVEEVRVFTQISLIMLQTYYSLPQNPIIKGLTKWFLDVACTVVKRPLTEKEWVDWIRVGLSNAKGDSFGEVHRADPMITMAYLPAMDNHKTFLLSKYEQLANNPRYSVLKHSWDQYLKSLK